jgi:MFS family permease
MPASGGARAGPWVVVLALGITQITSWGSIYYVFSLLMEPLQRELGADKTVVVGAFSLALLVSGSLAPFIGGRIDRHGGRRAMALGSLLGAIGLAALAFVDNVLQLYAVWLVLGAAMAATLYDPAFAVVTQAFRDDYRKAIAVLTLFGGFASTVFWPLSQALITQFGWRDAVLVLALVNLALCVPLHLIVLPAAPQRPPPSAALPSPGMAPRAALRDPTFVFLCLAFTVNAMVLSAMAVHMLAMLVSKGLAPAQAATFGALVGPMQVAGRLTEVTVGRRFSPLRVGIVAMAMQPASLLLFHALPAGLSSMLLFALLYGAGNGVVTIVRGTIPAYLYGREHYGAINGLMASPVLVAKALGPVLAALVWALAGSYDGVVLALASAASLALLFVWLAVRNRAAVARSA